MKSTHFHCCSKSYWGYWPYWWASQWVQYLWRGIWTTSEIAICPVVRHGNVNSIQNPSTVTNQTMGPFCILLPLTLPCRTTWQIANSLLSPHADFFFFFFTLSYYFILWFDLPICGNEQVVIFIPTNVQFENVSFFIKVSDEEKFLLF